MAGTYGTWGGPNKLFDAYKEWSEERLSLTEAYHAGEVDEESYALALGLPDVESLAEADTRADFPNFLFGPIRTSLWGGYRRVMSNWRRYVRVENMPDFRERRIKGLNSVRGIGIVGEYGEYPEMYRTERPGTALSIDTYGGVYGLTRHAIRNDETGELLNRVPGDMGYASARFVTQAIIALIEGNPTTYDGNPMFGSAHGNQGTAALSEDSLASAFSFMENQLDEDGFQIAVTPALIVVKNLRQELVGRRIINSTQTGTTQTYTGAAGAGSQIMDKGTDNPLQGVLPADGVVRDPFFSDDNDWYLFADPGDTPSFAVGFLDGNDQPFIGLKNPEVRNALGAGVDPYTFEFDVVEFKVRLDVGVAAVDWRGAYRNLVP